MTTTATQATTTLFSNDGGQISCARHGGSYLRSAVAAKPQARSHRTPLGTWTALTRADLYQLAAMIGAPVFCDECVS